MLWYMLLNCYVCLLFVICSYCVFILFFLCYSRACKLSVSGLAYKSEPLYPPQKTARIIKLIMSCTTSAQTTMIAVICLGRGAPGACPIKTEHGGWTHGQGQLDCKLLSTYLFLLRISCKKWTNSTQTFLKTMWMLLNFLDLSHHTNIPFLLYYFVALSAGIQIQLAACVLQRFQISYIGRKKISLDS